MILGNVIPIEELERVTELLKTGGPYAVTAIFLFLFLWERWKNDRKDKAILKMSLQHERGRSKIVEVLAHLKEVLRTVSDRVGLQQQTSAIATGSEEDEDQT